MKLFELTLTPTFGDGEDIVLRVTNEQYVGLINTVQKGNALVFFTEEGNPLTEGCTMLNMSTIARMTATPIEVNLPPRAKKSAPAEELASNDGRPAAVARHGKGRKRRISTRHK